MTNGTAIKTQDVPMHGCDQSVSLTLPGCSVFFLECVKKTPKRVRRTAAKKPAAKKPAARSRPRKQGAHPLNCIPLKKPLLSPFAKTLREGRSFCNIIED